MRAECPTCRWLKGLLVAQASFLPDEWRLTRSESNIMGTLMAYGRPDMGILIERLYAALHRDEPEHAVQDVRGHIQLMRGKLEPFGIKIVNHYGGQYELQPTGAQIVMRYM